MKKSCVSCTQRSTSFQLLHRVLQDEREPNNHIMHANKDSRGSKVRQHTELLDTMVSQWIRVEYLPRIHHIAVCPWSPRVAVKIERTTRRFHWTDDHHVYFQRHHMEISRQWTGMRLIAILVSNYAKSFSPGRWSFLGLGLEKKWYSTHGSKPKGQWDRVAELVMFKFSESGHRVFRATGALSGGTPKAKVVENCQYILRWAGND